MNQIGKDSPIVTVLLYPGTKIDALAAFLEVDADDVQVWSDNSLTVGYDTSTEYWVTTRKKTTRKYLGKMNGFHISKSL